MTDFIKEMEQLQRRMAELERQKEEHEAKELQKRTSMKHNLDVIRKQLLTKDEVYDEYLLKTENNHKEATKLMQAEHDRLCRISQENDHRGMNGVNLNCGKTSIKKSREIQYEINCLNGCALKWDHVTAETVYNMLKIIDNRLTKLENNI